MSRPTRDGTAESVSRGQILRRERGQGNSPVFIFPSQLTTSRIGNLDPYSCLVYVFDHRYCSRESRASVSWYPFHYTWVSSLNLKSVLLPAVPAVFRWCFRRQLRSSWTKGHLRRRKKKCAKSCKLGSFFLESIRFLFFSLRMFGIFCFRSQKYSQHQSTLGTFNRVMVSRLAVGGLM